MYRICDNRHQRVKFEMGWFVIANCNILEIYYVKYSSKNLEKFKETL